MKYCFFRLDAYPKIGTGHLVRCKILADYLSESGFSGIFLISPLSVKIAKANQINFHIIDEDRELENIIEVCLQYKSSKILVTDGDKELYYQENFQKELLANNIFLMTISMRSDRHFYSNIVLNQNILALSQNYSHEKYTKLLLGPQYVLLDRKFLNTSKLQKKISHTLPQLLINFGGADVHNLTLLVYKEVRHLKGVISKINIVVGKLYEPIEALKAAIDTSLGAIPVDLYIDTNEMPNIMHRSDFAITSGGLTVWELMYLKIPNIVISTSERERVTANELVKSNCIYYLGHQKIPEGFLQNIITFINDQPGIQKLTSQSCVKIDGKGLERVCKEIVSLL